MGNSHQPGLNLTQGTGTTLYQPGLGESFAATGDRYYSITLISGIVGCHCKNYIPVNDLQGSIQVRITLAHWNELGKYTTALAVDSGAALSIRNIEFHCNMIKLSPHILSVV